MELDYKESEESDFTLFGDFLQINQRKRSPLQRWKEELDVYRDVARPLPSTDPLLWWKCNSFQFPGLSNASFSSPSSFLYFYFFSKF